jgi:hypothetical protein
MTSTRFWLRRHVTLSEGKPAYQFYLIGLFTLQSVKETEGWFNSWPLKRVLAVGVVSFTHRSALHLLRLFRESNMDSRPLRRTALSVEAAAVTNLPCVLPRACKCTGTRTRRKKNLRYGTHLALSSISGQVHFAQTLQFLPTESLVQGRIRRKRKKTCSGAGSMTKGVTLTNLFCQFRQNP